MKKKILKYRILVCTLLMIFPGTSICENRNGTFMQAFSKEVNAFNEMNKKSRSKYILSHNALTPYLSYSEKMAQNYPIEDIKEIEKQAIEGKGSSSGMAWVLLALLSEKKPEAQEFIKQHAVKGNDLALQAVSFMPIKVANNTAIQVIEESNNWRTREILYKLLGYIGTNEKMIQLKDLAKEEKSNNVLVAINTAQKNLEYKIKLSMDKQSEWEKYGIIYWRLMHEISRPANLGGEYELAAKYLSENKIYVPSFILKYHLANSEWPDGKNLSVAIAGMQKTNECVEVLIPCSRKEGWEGSIAQAALAKIGNEASLEALAQQITPDDIDKNREIANLLGTYGSEAAIRVLMKYCEDPNYKESHIYFQEAIDTITNRLMATSKQVKNKEPDKESFSK